VPTTSIRTPSPLLLPFDDPENRSTDSFDAAAAAQDEQLLEGAASFSMMCGKDSSAAASRPIAAGEPLGMFTALSNLQKTLSGAFLWQPQQRTTSKDFPDSDPAVVGMFKPHPFDEETLGAPMDDDYADGTSSNNRAAALEQQGAILTASEHHPFDEIPINNSFDSAETETQEVILGEEARLAIPFDILGVKTNAEAAAPAPLFLRRQTRYGE